MGDSIPINRCRMCGNSLLDDVLDLGNLCLTGVFPKESAQPIPKSRLQLAKCSSETKGSCGLLQLRHTFDKAKMFGDEYGYRSGLNTMMTNHLRNKAQSLSEIVNYRRGDLILDIGSNDSTFLQCFPVNKGLELVGIDPVGSKFKDYYPPHIELIPLFFEKSIVSRHLDNKKAKVVTSISMFYDLDAPLRFAEDVHDILSNDGVWHLEQSYMPAMLRNNSYDTICHEHLEYYGLSQLKWIMDKVGFKIMDLDFNDINGGSIALTVAKKTSRYAECTSKINGVLRQEAEAGLVGLGAFTLFKQRVIGHRRKLVEFVGNAKAMGKRVFGLGASTKGNVTLQYCGFSEDDINFIGEVNPLKFGRFTPGSRIPIIPEGDLVRKKPDYLLVLPWHFRQFFASNRQSYGPSQLVFPFPEISII